MQRELIEYLKSIPERSEYVICMEDGSRVHHWHFYKRFKKILKAIGLNPKDYAPKELRHTTGTLMYLKGAPVKAIADQLRHEDQKTTMDFYIGADPDYQRSQNELLTLAQAEA
jgi:integrase